MSNIKEDKNNDDHVGAYKVDLPKSTADFQCSVCGAIFTTDQDRKQHLEKEAHGVFRDDTTPKELSASWIANTAHHKSKSFYHDRILVPRLQKVNLLVPKRPDDPSSHQCGALRRLHKRHGAQQGLDHQTVQYHQ